MIPQQPMINGDELQIDLAFIIHKMFLTKRIYPTEEEPLPRPAMPLLERYALSSVAIQYTDELTAYYARVLERIAAHKKQLTSYRFYFVICLCFYQAEQVVDVFQFDYNDETRRFVNDLAHKKANQYDWFVLDQCVEITIRTTETDLLMQVTNTAVGEDLGLYRFTRHPFQERLRDTITRVEMIEHAIDMKLQGTYFGFSSAL